MWGQEILDHCVTSHQRNLKYFSCLPSGSVCVYLTNKIQEGDSMRSQCESSQVKEKSWVSSPLFIFSVLKITCLLYLTILIWDKMMKRKTTLLGLLGNIRLRAGVLKTIHCSKEICAFCFFFALLCETLRYIK
jgi:hypothetical protein